MAVSDSRRTMALPRPVVEVDGTEAQAIDSLIDLIEEEAVVCVVVGLPTHLDGRESPSSRRARDLAEELRDRLAGSQIEVELHDERLTTSQAAGALRSAGHSERSQRRSIDSAAASVLLEAWMQCH